MKNIGFIGAGTVGTALAVRLSQKGYRVVAVASRSKASLERFAQRVPGSRMCDNNQAAADAADVVFITTPDDVIGKVAAEIRWRRGQCVAHCSGADSVAVLEPARKAGAEVGSFHPLQTFASIDQAIANIPGSTFAVEAEGEVLEALKGMALAVGGNWFKLRSEDKVLYHAAAVFACNYLYTLVKLSTDLWQDFGVSTPEATRALLPLIKGSVNNLENVGLPNCLTGPIARGDLGTIRKHLGALEKSAPQLLSTYRELGRQTIPLAMAKGRIDAKRGEELRQLLS